MNFFEEHRERVVTGALLAGAVLVIGFFHNLFLIWLFLGGVYIVAFYEAMKLYDIQNDKLFVVALLIWILAYFYPDPENLFILTGITYASMMAYSKNREWNDFLPFAYPTVGMLFMLALYKDFGIFSLFWLLVVVAATDIGAYVVGKSIGKTPFSPTSPKKTLEGVGGGVLSATALGAFIGLGETSFFAALAISFGVAVASVFGDLYESSLKRAADVKDSGTIFPGHGGMLDRVDGYLFGGVVMLVLLRGVA